MVSGHTGNVVLRKELRVRAPCPPLVEKNHKKAGNALFHGLSGLSRWVAKSLAGRLARGTNEDKKSHRRTISGPTLVPTTPLVWRCRKESLVEIGRGR
jgi:hypothetical protein